MNEERKKKTSDTMKKKMTPELRLKMGLKNKGRKLSLEHREKIRQRMINNNPMKNLETRKKVSDKIKQLHKEGIYKK